MIGQQLGNVVFLDAEKGMNDAGADLGIDVATATRERLAAKNIMDLVEWSGGLYDPPAKFLPKKDA